MTVWTFLNDVTLNGPEFEPPLLVLYVYFGNIIKEDNVHQTFSLMSNVKIYIGLLNGLL